MSTGGELLFVVCGLIAVVAAVLTVSLSNPLRSAVALLTHVTALAGLYLTLHAHLLAAVQLLVSAGAVVVLFVFVIMLLGPGALDSKAEPRGWISKTVGAGLLALVAGAIAFAVGKVNPETVAIPGCPDGQAECSQFGGVNALSAAIYRDAAIPFELVSMLLLVAIIAAITIARGRTRDEKELTDSVDARRFARRAFPSDAEAPLLNPAKMSTGPLRGQSDEPSAAE